MTGLKIITYDQNHDFLLELNGISYWITWDGFLMDENCVAIPEDAAVSITAELDEAGWRELAEAFMGKVREEIFGSAADKPWLV